MKVIYAFFVFFLLLEQKAIANDCHNATTSHPEIISCMQQDVAKSEYALKKLIAENGSTYEISMEYYEYQRRSIVEKCRLYLNAGGQRSEILETQCEVDETQGLLRFIRSYMQAMDEG